MKKQGRDVTAALKFALDQMARDIQQDPFPPGLILTHEWFFNEIPTCYSLWA
jgi:hypothetical protein